ncbi:hypothetical protein W04_2876 [Pseudoalteromonas sp. SW0106-04]|nr:hypothetical protein W04_2876 [Pseudoalteromonas sp. SW0106-04]
MGVVSLLHSCLRYGSFCQRHYNCMGESDIYEMGGIHY